jgi:hypothetical protein
MDGPRFDRLTKRLASGMSRRGVVGGAAAGLAAGLAGKGVGEAQACPPGRVYRRGVGCVCRQTGRPPVGGTCPCPRGQTDTGDGRGCLACRADGDCPAGDECVSWACGGGTCVKSTTICDDGQGLCTTKGCDPATGCGFAPIDCDDHNACTTDSCDPATGCLYTSVVCEAPTPVCDPALGCVACLSTLDCAAGNACVANACVACPAEGYLLVNGGCFQVIPSLDDSGLCNPACETASSGVEGADPTVVCILDDLTINCNANGNADCPAGRACDSSNPDSCVAAC